MLRIGINCMGHSVWRGHGVWRKKKSPLAFTLMEVMVATAILSSGIVLIYQAFFISVDSFNYCSNYLNVASWIDEKIWQVQDNLSRLGPSALIERKGIFINRGRDFNWNLSYNLIDVAPNLYKIDLVLFQEKGKRKIKLSRTAYAIYEEE